MEQINVQAAVDDFLATIPLAEIISEDELRALREFREAKTDLENMKVGLGSEDAGREHGAFMARFRSDPSDQEAAAFISTWPDAGAYILNRQQLLTTIDGTVRARMTRVAPVLAAVSEKCRTAAARLADVVRKEERLLWAKWAPEAVDPPTPLGDAVACWRVDGHHQRRPHPLSGEMWPKELFGVHLRRPLDVLPRVIREALAKHPGSQREASGGASHPSR